MIGEGSFLLSRPITIKDSGVVIRGEAPAKPLLATRDEFGDVCILDDDIWRGRVDCYSGGGRQC